MADPTTSPLDPPLADDETIIKIERDPSFVRLFADEVTVINKGAFTELSLLVMGPDPDLLLLKTGERGVIEQTLNTRLRPSYTEVGRVRLTSSDAAELALEIFARGIDRDQINAENVKKAIDAFVAAQKLTPKAEVEAEAPSEQG